jgi:hypothetical protein
LFASVESAAYIVSLVVSAVVELDNVQHDDQLEQSSEMSTLKLHPKVFINQKNLEISRNELGESW